MLNIARIRIPIFRSGFTSTLQGARDEDCTIRFVNAGKTTYPNGWTEYQVVASYDNQEWFRVPTKFDGKVMTISHTPGIR